MTPFRLAGTGRSWLSAEWTFQSFSPLFKLAHSHEASRFVFQFRPKNLMPQLKSAVAHIMGMPAFASFGSIRAMVNAFAAIVFRRIAFGAQRACVT
jgi:hypothetical protein